MSNTAYWKENYNAVVAERDALAAELEQYRQAEKDGPCMMLKAAIGDRVRDLITDYEFTVKQIDIYENTIVYRCGNVGTEDYAAFHDSEYGERFTRAEQALKGGTDNA